MKLWNVTLRSPWQIHLQLFDIALIRYVLIMCLKADELDTEMLAVVSDF